MKAPDFEYARPDSIEEAISLLSPGDLYTLPLAGGQSLMAMMNLRVAAPDCLVDLSAISELSGIEDKGSTISIGAMTRHVEMGNSELVAEHLPLISAAINDIAHVAIRNRGTIGGSLALADPAAELPACCIAYDATIITHGTSGEKRTPADGFFVGIFETVLGEGELIKAIEFDKRGNKESQFAFAELARRKGDYAMVGIAMSANGTQTIVDPRIVLFGVSDKPERAVDAEKTLEGSPINISEEILEKVSNVVTEGIDFSGDLHASASTKEHLSTVLVKRALIQLSEGSQL